MFSNIFNSKPIKIAIFFSTLLILNECGLYRKTDAREISTNAKDRMAKNVEEGRSIKFGKLGRGSGTFEFASSNEMWRATIEILDFVPLTSADYGGGIVITDWYNDTSKNNESIKIMVQFLSNEIRADGLKVIVYNRFCNDGNLNSCQTDVNETSVSEEIKLAILKKASIYKNIKTKEIVDAYKKKVPTRNKDLSSNNNR
tara:strand:- start:35 stop:634 length:600 start_codon:yes stop_codon:yes gene_type:complete